MFARVTVVEGSPDKADAGIESFNNQVVPAIKGVDGYKGAMLLLDRSTGKGLGISLWDSEDARERGGQAVAEARSAAIAAMGGSVPPVDNYEVAAIDM